MPSLLVLSQHARLQHQLGVGWCVHIFCGIIAGCNGLRKSLANNRVVFSSWVSISKICKLYLLILLFRSASLIVAFVQGCNLPLCQSALARVTGNVRSSKWYKVVSNRFLKGTEKHIASSLVGSEFIKAWVLSMFIPVDGMFPSLIGRGYNKACRRRAKYLGLSRTSPQFWYGVLREKSNKHLPGMIKWLISFRQEINKKDRVALSIQALRYFSRWSTSHWKWWGIWFIIFTGISYIFIPVSLCLNMWVSFCYHRLRPFFRS